MVDPALLEFARLHQRKLGTVVSRGVLEPVAVLLAEYVYLGYAPKHMWELVQHAGIDISYGGMCVWVKRHFGVGPTAVKKAGAYVQKAVDDGAFESPYFKQQTSLEPFQETTLARVDAPPEAAPAVPISKEISRTRNSGNVLENIVLVATPQSVEEQISRTRNSSDTAPLTQAKTHVPPDDAATAEKAAKRAERHRIVQAAMSRYDSPLQRLEDEKVERLRQLELERSKK